VEFRTLTIFQARGRCLKTESVKIIKKDPEYVPGSFSPMLHSLHRRCLIGNKQREVVGVGSVFNLELLVYMQPGKGFGLDVVLPTHLATNTQIELLGVDLGDHRRADALVWIVSKRKLTVGVLHCLWDKFLFVCLPQTWIFIHVSVKQSFMQLYSFGPV